MSTTPAQLSLEIGVSQKRIREYLREQSGRLPGGVSRWELDESTSDAVRERFIGEVRDSSWLLEVGAQVRRKDLHAAYGGSQQSGIVTFPGRSDIFVFTSPSSGARYGYDAFEGLQPDGSFAYTGQGQHGNQEFNRGNLAIRDSGPADRPIRVFAVEGTWATYVGEFATGEPTYRQETIPDADGLPREGIIFNLVPVVADTSPLVEPQPLVAAQPYVAAWSPPDYSDVVVALVDSSTATDRVVSRIEFRLQADFGDWLLSRGQQPARLPLSIDGTVIEPDMYVESSAWIVEAKRSIGRDYVRTAVGQVLDYVHVAETVGIQGTPVVLLPGRPTSSLMDLLDRHGITLVHRDGESFAVVEPSVRRESPQPEGPARPSREWEGAAD